MDRAHKITRTLVVVLGAVALAAIIGRQWMVRRSPATAHVQPISTYGTIGDFKLTDQAGRAFGSAELKGRVWVADFVFTRCMGPCPLLTTKMAELQAAFASKKELHFVSFTVDPEFDTPAVLASYAKKFGANKPNWSFLTGKQHDVHELIRKNFKLAVEPQSETDIMHSLSFVLVGKEGEILGVYNTSDPESMAILRGRLEQLS